MLTLPIEDRRPFSWLTSSSKLGLCWCSSTYFAAACSKVRTHPKELCLLGFLHDPCEHLLCFFEPSCTSAQNFAVEDSGRLHLAQARPGAAHSSQNFAPSSFWWRHFGHFINGPKSSPNGL